MQFDTKETQVMKMLFLLNKKVVPLPKMADKTVLLAAPCDIPKWLISKKYLKVDVAVIEIIPEITITKTKETDTEPKIEIDFPISIITCIVKYIKFGTPVVLLFHVSNKEFMPKLVNSIKKQGQSDDYCYGWTYDYTEQGITTQEVDKLINHLQVNWINELKLIEDSIQ